MASSRVYISSPQPRLSVFRSPHLDYPITLVKTWASLQGESKQPSPCFSHWPPLSLAPLPPSAFRHNRRPLCMLALSYHAEAACSMPQGGSFSLPAEPGLEPRMVVYIQWLDVPGWPSAAPEDWVRFPSTTEGTVMVPNESLSDS